MTATFTPLLSEGSQLQHLYNPTTDVKGYGADPTGVNDSTIALQQAINAAVAAGLNLPLPAGTFKISSPLTITGAIVIVGAGANLTAIQLASGFVGSAAFLITGGNDAQIRDLNIAGISSTYSSNPAADGIDVAHSIRVLLANLLFFNLNGTAVKVTSDATGDSLFNILNNCHSVGCAAGFALVGTASTDHIVQAQLVNCNAENCQSGDGLLILDAEDIQVTNFFGYTASGNALHLKGAAQRIVIENAEIGVPAAASASSGATALIEVNSSRHPANISISNSIFQGGLTGLTITDGKTIEITNCQIINNGTHGVSITGTTADQVTITACVFSLNGLTAASTNYDINSTFSGKLLVTGCQFITPNGTSANQTANAINPTTGTQEIFGNWFIGNSGANAFAATPTVARSNAGYNPAGFQSAPSVPSSTVAVQNTFGVDCWVYILAGTITVIGVGSTTTTTATGLLSSAAGVSVFVPAGWYIKMTYSGAPTWTWYGV